MKNSVFIGLAMFFIASASYANSVTIRPISDFVNAQGSIMADAGPVHGGELYLGKLFIWGNSLKQLYRIDYSGTDDKGLVAVGGPDVGTTFSGYIVETPFDSNRVEDTIHLVTHNALAFVVNASDPTQCFNGSSRAFVLCPALFGYNSVEMANSIGAPVLVDSVMDVKLIKPIGMPMPDLVALPSNPSSNDSYLESISIKATTVGPLRSAFGVSEGALGLADLDVKQSGQQVTLGVLGK